MKTQTQIKDRQELKTVLSIDDLQNMIKIIKKERADSMCKTKGATTGVFKSTLNIEHKMVHINHSDLIARGDEE